jgi:autoinducer 2 (AI-2) kinase
MVTPDDGSAFTRELDADDVRTALQRLLDAAAPGRNGIAGVAVTGQREGVAFIDEMGGALLLSPNIDGRAAMEGMTIDAAYGDRVYAVTGHLPALLQAPAKLAWLREHRAEAAERVRGIVPLADWIAGLLTGERVITRSLASEIGLLDISTGAIAGPLLEALGVGTSLVSPVVDDGTVIGTARDGALKELPVALCGGDTQCALAGMGVLDGGSAGVTAGWSTPVQMVANAPILDAGKRIWTGLHVLADRWVLESNAGDCGRAWEWVCSMLGTDAASADRAAAASPPGAHDAITVLGPAVMRASTMNVTTGAITVPMPLALWSPSQGDLARSALEAVAYAIRANLEQLEEIAGAHASSVALGGGMTASSVFPQIVADVLGRPMAVARSPQTSAVGAAAIASPAFGLHDTIGQAIAAMSGGTRSVEPNNQVSATYEDCYERWHAMAALLEPGAM